MRFAVVIPTFNEAHSIARCLEAIGRSNDGHDVSVTVSDGGSHDGTCEVARSSSWAAPNQLMILGKAPAPDKGRGAQLSHAVETILATNERKPPQVFLFLHADCCLNAGAFSALAHAFERRDDDAHGSRDAPPRIVTMRLRFRMSEKCTATQRRILRTSEDWCNHGAGGLFRSFGDAAIAASPAALRAVGGGFPSWPLFEDVEFMRRARRCQDHGLVSVRKLSADRGDAAVVWASPRRFETEGYVAYPAKCWFLIALFKFGVPPEKLSRMYGKRKGGTPGQHQAKVRQICPDLEHSGGSGSACGSSGREPSGGDVSSCGAASLLSCSPHV